MKLSNEFSTLTMDEMEGIDGGAFWATVAGVAKAAALFGGSAIVVGGAVVACGLVIYNVVN